MELYIDSADIEKIKHLVEWLPIDGITVNPSIISKNKTPLFELLKQLLPLSKKFLHVQVLSNKKEDIMLEAETLHNISEKIIVKIPATKEGLSAIKEIDTEKITITATAVFSVTQALISAKAGAKYIAPYVSRVNKIEQSGTLLVKEIKETICNIYKYPVKIIAASVKSSYEVKELLNIGVDAITLSPEIMYESCTHFLTDQAVAMFSADWEKTFKEFKLDSELKLQV